MMLKKAAHKELCPTWNSFEQMSTNNYMKASIEAFKAPLIMTLVLTHIHTMCTNYMTKIGT